jgi:hypothetical protein
VSPYLIVGAGQIDFGNDFRDSLGQARRDLTSFILGGGASLRLTDRVRLNGAIRDYIMTTDESLDDVASTGDLTHNTMLTAGLTISFGGRTERAAPPLRPFARRSVTANCGNCAQCATSSARVSVIRETRWPAGTRCGAIATPCPCRAACSPHPTASS